MLLLFHGQVDEFKDLFVLDLFLGFEEGFIERKSSQGCGFTFGDHDCDFELSDDDTWLFDEDWIWDEKFVIETLFETESGHIGIFEAVHAETERRISSQHIVEELPALFDFQVVGSIEGSLVDICSDFSLS